MKKVRYTGEDPALLPTLNVQVSRGDVITVPDDFDADNFAEVKPKTDK